MPKPPVVIPPEFWRALPDAEFLEIMENNGRLNAGQCARVWRIAGFDGEPPPSMEVRFSREEVMRIWPPKKRSP